MSRYALDKILWQLAHQEDRELFERYLADPGSVLAGRDLSDEECKALTNFDIGELYRMGVQPFLLLDWSRLVAKSHGEAADAFNQRYIKAVTPHGCPDFAT